MAEALAPRFERHAIYQWLRRGVTVSRGADCGRSLPCSAVCSQIAIDHAKLEAILGESRKPLTVCTQQKICGQGPT